MKKFFITIGLILGLTTNVFGSYKNLTISPEAASIISSLRISSDFTKVSTFDGVGYYALKYNDISIEFKNLVNTDTKEYSHTELYNYKSANIKLGKYIQVNSELYKFNSNGICHSFIKSVAPLLPNKFGKQSYFGKRLYPNMSIKSGSIILSHGNKNKSGHIAIILSVRKDYILVMDQNSYIYDKNNYKHRGIVGIHKIKFKTKVWYDNPKYYDNSNAYNYHLYRY